MSVQIAACRFGVSKDIANSVATSAAEDAPNIPVAFMGSRGTPAARTHVVLLIRMVLGPTVVGCY